MKCVVSMAEQVRTPSPMPSPWKKSGCCLLLETALKVQQLYSVVAVGALEPSWLPTTASSWVQSRYNLVLNCLQVVDRPGVWQRGAEDGHPPLLCHRGEGEQVHLLDDIHRGRTLASNCKPEWATLVLTNLLNGHQYPGGLLHVVRAWKWVRCGGSLN